MESGWIKIFSERLLEWEWYHDTKMVRVFLHMLLKANYKSKRWEGIEIKRGQFVTSLANLSAELGLSVKSIRTCLTKLQTTGEIGKQTASKFTVITICNYDKYQGSQCDEGQAKGKQGASEGQAKGKQGASEGQAKGKQGASEGQQLKNIRNKKERKNNNIDANASSSGAAAPDPDLSSQESVDFVGLMNFFNRTMEEAGAIIPRCKSCDGKRREFVRARIREHGLDAVYEMITKASRSDFLNGKSRNGWIADFTWLFRPSNFQKVLEGNYDNRTNNYNGQQNNQPSTGSNSTNPLARARIIKADG